MKHTEIIKKKLIRICSRPDLGIVSILEIMNFGKMKCIRSSKGGVFDEFDIMPVSKEDEAEFRKIGGDSAHSTREWTEKKEGSMANFFCAFQNEIVTTTFCANVCFPRKKDYVTRAQCKADNAPDAPVVDVPNKPMSLGDRAFVHNSQLREEARHGVAVAPLGSGIQELRLKKIEKLMKEEPTTNP